MSPALTPCEAYPRGLPLGAAATTLVLAAAGRRHGCEMSLFAVRILPARARAGTITTEVSA